ncbi:DUF4962 domain-containing protein [Paenibacillus glucanolyticus]|uniref:DUF4962 domain-containing protein n=1 Tax=Paenibacillus glucanolyticus TaxID=59843 RepID=UPI00096C940D|nr:DUF4962 domain-containing protein [Paenibacillus glucanolyticus]OMF78676.1 alginate lyase [Paenibacillus glucanolyticus]
MKTLFEPKSGLLSVPYQPDEETKLLENPPRFTWMPGQLENDRYMLQISSSPSFETEVTTTIAPIPYNLYTLDHALEPGTYYWRYALLIGEQARYTAEDGNSCSSWSQSRMFHVPEGLPKTPLPGRAARYEGTDTGHPRLWLDARGVEEFRERLRNDDDYCGWRTFYEKSVVPWLDKPLIPEPERYPGNKRVAKLWRKMYMDCQETLYAIRHLSVAGVILQDETMISKAKAWLLHAASWDTEGTTSRDYNDEAAFRMVGAIAWGYDWLHDVLSADEIDLVRGVLLRRTEQVAFHIMERSKIHHVPYDSHAVRSLSSVLAPACIAMLHEEARAQAWLDYTLEYYACLYSPWGGEDGGWAEGPLYWTTGMAFVIDALNLIRNYVSIDFYKRPFFRRTGDFPLYCSSPDTIRASFGDQSYLGEPVSLKTAFNIRQFAGITGNGHYQWYFEQVASADTDPDTKFYNYGWWDFRFDDMLYRHDYPQVEAVPPSVAVPSVLDHTSESKDGPLQAVKWFRDIDWVAMHHRMDDPDEHIMLLAKSSRYGSMSHSHGDQNGFLLHAYGEPLAIESGYYIAFGSTMHMNWRRQTRSTNNILIDGHGQYAGKDKVLCMEAGGKVERVDASPGYGYTRMNATQAYRENVPYLERYVREIYFFDEDYFVIVDTVDLVKPASIEWLFHTLNRMKLSGQTFRVMGDKAEMEGRFVYSSSGDLSLHQHNQFTDVEPEEIEGLDNQWHLHAKTKSAQSHRIATLLVPMKKDESKYVSYFLDDQDHGVHIYFTNEDGKTRKVEVPKAY